MHLRYMHHGYIIMDTCTIYSCIIDLCIIYSCIIDLCIIYFCIIAVEVEKEVLVKFAWVTRPERPQGAKDEVKRPEGPPPKSRG